MFVKNKKVYPFFNNSQNSLLDLIQIINILFKENP